MAGKSLRLTTGIMLLLQTKVTGSLDTVQFGMWVIGGMLAVIVGLIIAIWQDNKKQAESKHTDLVTLIDKLDSRQDKLDDEQRQQAFQLIALDTTIKVMQGHPIDLNNLHKKEK